MRGRSETNYSAKKREKCATARSFKTGNTSGSSAAVEEESSDEEFGDTLPWPCVSFNLSKQSEWCVLRCRCWRVCVCFLGEIRPCIVTGTPLCASASSKAVFQSIPNSCKWQFCLFESGNILRIRCLLLLFLRARLLTALVREELTVSTAQNRTSAT